LGLSTVTEPKSLVLGASGFIGTRLVRHLVEQGQPVRAVDILPPRVVLPGVEYLDLDVRRPLPDAAGQGVSRLYNLAAVHRTPGHPADEYYETNVLGAIHATALADRCGVGTIVFTSSISVYGPCEDTVSESSPLRPASSYGRSKRMAELIHERWLETGEGRRLIVVRPGVVFGPGEVGNYTRLARALRGGYFFFPGRRDTVKSGGYVDELVLTLDFALARNERYVLYNFAYPEISTTEAIVEALGRLIGKRRKPPTLPVTPLLVAASAFEVLNALGVKNTIHRDEVMKLVRSTRISPEWLKSNGYPFTTDLEVALGRWRDETQGRFD
jgi:nucleoside-diphosphate-sugar epimerase